MTERPRLWLGKLFPGGFAAQVEIDEYRRMAAVEDEMWFYRALHAHVERALTAALGPDAGGTILDAGCGTGGLIRRLGARRPAWRWTGIDLEPVACELARTRCGPAVDIVEGSVTALPFGDASFDAVVSSDVLYHLDDDSAALAEIFRVLRPGGSVVINVPAHRWLWSYHDRATHARRRYERSELRSRLDEAGFETIAATHWNTLPLPLIWARRKLFRAPESGSDVKLYPRPIEAMFSAAMRLERKWLESVSNLPLGSSILATAKKPGRSPDNSL